MADTFVMLDEGWGLEFEIARRGNCGPGRVLDHENVIGPIDDRDDRGCGTGRVQLRFR